MGNVIGSFVGLDDNDNIGDNISEYDDEILKDANMASETILEIDKHFENVVEQNINYNIVSTLEKNLDTYEKVSLVFLLYDSLQCALKIINDIISSDGKSATLTPVSGWAKGPEWKLKLLEALSIIQNYEELTSLGFNRTDVDRYFLPHKKNKYKYIDKFRKFLFMFCETFTCEDCKRLIDSVQVHDEISRYCSDEVYLEVHFLSWINHGDISIDDKKSTNLNFLITKLRQLEFVDKASEIENLIKTEENVWEEMYKILDHTDVGICLIINQRDFYADRRPEFADEVNKELDNREGTDADCESLRQTFKHFNISVHIRDNLAHDEMKSEIISVVESSIKDQHAMFFLCILSHGVEGAVYGSNGIRVEIDSIIEWLTFDLYSKLRGKPKVVIVQACQGTNVQKIDDDDDDVDTDAPHPKQRSSIPSRKVRGVKERTPKLCDVLLCQPVVPGYVALRSKNQGSIYIQILCKQLNKSGKKKDFMSIMLDVNDEVSRFYHSTYGVMTPRFIVQLRKKLYLVPISGST